MTDDVREPPSLETLRALASEGSFEETLMALEAVVDHLERGRLSIDESVSWYEIGLRLSRRCTDMLQQAELRIRSVEDRYAVASQRDIDWDEETP
ncbi:MAG: exodeoxyribonuclease VII small subunit [Thermomicrobiales bacterium]